MLEYASIRLIFTCGMATRLPTVIVMAESAMISGVQLSTSGAIPVASTRTRMANPAALEPTERKAVIGVGAPSYASGDHWWNGTMAILKPKPTSTKIVANKSSVCDTDSARKAAAIALMLVVPVIP